MRGCQVSAWRNFLRPSPRAPPGTGRRGAPREAGQRSRLSEHPSSHGLHLRGEERKERRKGGSDPSVALTHSKQTHFQLAYRHHLPGARPLRIPGAPHCPAEAAQPRRGRPRRRSHAPGPASPLPPAPSAAGPGTERGRAGDGAASRAIGRAGERGRRRMARDGRDFQRPSGPTLLPRQGRTEQVTGTRPGGV